MVIAIDCCSCLVHIVIYKSDVQDQADGQKKTDILFIYMYVPQYVSGPYLLHF